MSKLTQDELKLALVYDPDTGIFVRISSGRIAGCVNKSLGYVAVSVYGKIFYGHRLAWLYMYGGWPGGSVDHINRDKKDNRIANLRIATKAQNAVNSTIVKAVSGRRGVYYQSNTDKWRAKLGNQHLGYFDSRDAASLAWQQAMQKRYGSFHGGVE